MATAMVDSEKDLDQKLTYEFIQAFMTVPGEPIVLNYSRSSWPGIRRSVTLQVGSEQRRVKDVVFPELSIPLALTIDLTVFLAEVSSLSAAWKVDSVSLHGLPDQVRQQLDVTAGWITRPLTGFWADLEKWSPSSRVRKALRKAATCGVYCTRATTRLEFQELRQTLDFLDFGSKDSPDCVDKQVSFFEKAYRRGRGIGLLAQRDGRTLAGMFSVVIRRRLYMLIHGYEPAAISFYPNDLLYANTIDAAKEVGAEIVCWGDVEPNDIGLARMKGKYSTRVMNNPSMHWLGNL
jgi:hypothetical protein